MANILGEKDVIILKVVTPPSMKDFGQLVAQVRLEAKKAGLKKANIQKIIKKIKKEKEA